MAKNSWREFAEAAPDLAERTKSRLDGRVSYLATVRKDGSPRVHPLTPIVSAQELYVFMEPDSPKGHDLRRDARFALHAGVEDVNGGGGECLVRGMARFVESSDERSEAAAASSYRPAERYVLFALSVQEVVLTTYGNAGPERARWRAAD